MTDQIFLFLETDLLLENSYCLILSNNGCLLESYEQTNLEQLKIFSQTKDLIIVLPATFVSAHLVELPTLKKSELMIPNILEENLISDIDETHFVLQSKVKIKDKYLICSISKNIFENLLLQFKKINFNPILITSELLCSMENSLLLGESGLQLIAQNNIGIIPDYLLEVVDLKLIDNLNILSFKNSSKGLIQFIKKHKLKMQTNHDLLYQQFVAQQILKQPSLNLQQGNYKPRQKHGLLKKFLGLPLLALSILIFVGSHIKHYQYMKHELQILKKDNFNRYKKVFPNASSMISPRFRIERLIKDGASNEQQLFISIMRKIAPILNHQNKLSIFNLSFQNRLINITFTMPSFSELEKLQQKLEDKSIIVNQVSATTKKDLVNALWRFSL